MKARTCTTLVARARSRARTAAQELRTLELTEPAGWIHLTLAKPTARGAAEGDEAAGGGVRAYLVQLVVLTNHQNGRDTHVRQIKLYGPRKCVRARPRARAQRGAVPDALSLRAPQGPAAGGGARGADDGGVLAVRGRAVSRACNTATQLHTKGRV